ncbi:MAG: hypothetical protein H6Q14_2275 [Bacteroidetes bacterium]|nr:hypothetical protein [Bacteroidota bacterium]
MINFYRTYIAEGKVFAIFAIIISILSRSWLFIDVSTGSSVAEDNGDGYIWSLLFCNMHLEDTAAILFGNFIVTLLICFVLSYTSWHYSLIREKTFLPFAISLMIFSCHQQFLLFSPSNVAALLYLTAICLSFGLYQEPKSQRGVFGIAAILGLALLISMDTLPYICLVFIAFVYLRILTLKNILSLFLGLLFILWIGFLTSLPYGHSNSFMDYFGQLDNMIVLHILHFSIVEWILSALYLLMMVVMIVDFRLNMHKDKIRIRSHIHFLFLLSFIFLLSYCFICWNLNFTLYLLLGTFIIPVSHYFALTYSKFKIIFFYLLIIIFLILTFGQSQLF